MKRKLSRVDLLQARKPWYLRTLFRIKGIESSGSHLSIIGSRSPPLPIDQLSDFLKYKPRPWGGTISIQGTKIKNIGFLKKAEAQRFVSQINKLIAPLIGEQIAYHAKDFRRLAEDTYLRDSSIEKLEDSTEEWLLRYKKSKPLWLQHLPTAALSTLERLSDLSPLSDHVDLLRENYIAMAMSRDKLFFDQVESNPLTDKQRLACLRNNDRNMVLAAAGTGKTSVIVAKAIHLIESRQATASDILILAYNRAVNRSCNSSAAARL